MQTIAFQIFFAFVALIFCGAIAYEVVQLLASLWDPIVDAWNSPRPRPKWRLRGKKRPHRATGPLWQLHKYHSDTTTQTTNHRRSSSQPATNGLMRRLLQHTKHRDR